MTTLREAVQQAVTMLKTPEYDWADVLDVLEDALEQPDQEPVAYWHKPNQEDEEFIHAQAVNGNCPDCVPLYTHPPRRPWRGLTDEGREQATGWSVEHIEAALKEKNT